MRYLLIILLLLTGLNSNAQEHSLLEHYDLNYANGKVTINWTILGGATCNGIQIYHTTDTTSFFKEIGEIPGICGNTIDSESYTHTDTKPKDGKVNYYRLKLGTQGFSSIKGIPVPINHNGQIQTFPNPGSDLISVQFENLQNEKFTIEVYDYYSRLIKSEKRSTGNTYQYHRTTEKSGVYFIKVLVGKDHSYSGNFLWY